MATIRKSVKKDGSVSYRAEIRIKRKGKVVHDDGRTFAKLKLAKAWAAKREAAIADGEIFGEKKPARISDLIDDYLSRFDAGRSKRFDLLRIAESEIAEIDANDLTASDLIHHCEMRAKTTKPQTVKNDVIWLKTVLDTMKAADNHRYSTEQFTTARITLRAQRLIGHSERRERRPTRAELMALSRFFYTKKMPYLHIMWFAVFSSRRLSEICKLRHDDINHDNRTILVRDLKNPEGKKLNAWAKLPRSAYKITQRQPKGELIFPYNPKSISTGFTRTCKLLGIEGLRFHDLRHEAVSRFFEHGLNIPQVQKISLHRSWASLSIYTNLLHDDIDI